MAAVLEIAHLQAWSLTTPVDWRSQIQTLDEQAEFVKGYVLSLPSSLQASKEKYPDYFGSIDVEKLAWITQWEPFLALMNEHRDFMKDVLVHGDYHLNNILYYKNPDGSVSDRLAAIIDFQFVQQ